MTCCGQLFTRSPFRQRARRDGAITFVYTHELPFIDDSSTHDAAAKAAAGSRCRACQAWAARLRHRPRERGPTHTHTKPNHPRLSRSTRVPDHTQAPTDIHRKYSLSLSLSTERHPAATGGGHARAFRHVGEFGVIALRFSPTQNVLPKSEGCHHVATPPPRLARLV